MLFSGPSLIMFAVQGKNRAADEKKALSYTENIFLCFSL